MNEQELKEVLLDSAYLIKQTISKVDDEIEQKQSLKVFNEIIKALHELQPTEQKIKDELLFLNDSLDIQENNKQEQRFTGASAFILQYGLMVEQQLNHKGNKKIIDECNNFINELGQERFIKVLTRIKKQKDNGTKIKSIQAYLHICLGKERKNNVRATELITC